MKDNIVSNKEMRSRRLRRDIFGRRTDPVSLPDVKRHGLDYPLLIAVVLLCAFGLLMLFSASYYYAQSYKGDGLYYVRRQLVYMLVGIGVMIGLSYVPYTLYSNRIVNYIIYIALIILLVIVLAFGRTAQGAQRWIAIGPITIQPSEFTKFVLVIVLANYMARNRTYMKNFVSGLLVPGILTLLPCILILLQPNLSMVIIIAIVFIVMVFLGGCNPKQLAVCFLLGLGGGLTYVFLKGGYQLERITMAWKSWEEILKYSGDETYQIVQSLYAFANGGLFGQGLDASRQKLLFLPYRESDYILPIIAEELGFVAVLLLLACYFFVIHRGYRIARRCSDRFGSLLAAGMTSILAVQVIINVAVVSGMMPATGQTLPFISSGGTSLAAFLASIGIVLNVSRYTEKNKADRV